jgi:hypothetical protein
MSKMGSHDPFGHLKHKLWPKEGLEVKLAIWFLTTKSWELTQFPCVQMACDISLEKLLMRAITFLETSSQLEVCMQSYGAPKSQESQHWQFRDFHLGVPGQNIIWMSEDSRLQQDSNSQNGSSLGSVKVYSLTLSCTLKSMRCDF